MWGEIDLATKLWTIPAFDPVTGRRMKSNETHVVPMSDRAIAILREARKPDEGPVVFPGGNGQPLSDNTLSKLIRVGNIAGTAIYAELPASLSST